jgi:Holliday junction DNA helicase RuvA
MIEFIEGKVDSITPTHVVVNQQGVGYFISISINTYEAIRGNDQLRILTHLSIKEDSHTLYGFYSAEERLMFRHLISVSGIGNATAILVLSSLSVTDLASAISSGNAALLKSIKGIGPKAAQRMILELKDKVEKTGLSHPSLSGSDSSVTDTLEALTALGFNRSAAEKAIMKVKQSNPSIQSTEDLIKESLKIL